jgi:hypothetical protein
MAIYLHPNPPSLLSTPTSSTGVGNVEGAKLLTWHYLRERDSESHSPSPVTNRYMTNLFFSSFNVTQRGHGRVSEGMEGGDEEATLGKQHLQWLELEFWS